MIRVPPTPPQNKPACVLRQISRLRPPPRSSASSANRKNVPWQRKKPLSKPPPMPKRHASKPQQSPRNNNRTCQPSSSAKPLIKQPPMPKKHANKP